MGDVSITTATDEAIVEEMRAISPEHWQELAENTDVFELDVDWNMYLIVHRAGHLHVTQVRDEAGALVGYHVVTVRRHPHNPALVADDAVSFIRPTVKNRVFVFLAMYEHSITALTDRGVRYFKFRVKVKRNFGFMLEKLGFSLTELAYTRTIRDDVQNKNG